MADNKKQIDELTAAELSELKGGIPYEKPDLINLEAAAHTCNKGVVCKKGSGILSCAVGFTCDTGTIEEPEG